MISTQQRCQLPACRCSTLSRGSPARRCAPTISESFREFCIDSSAGFVDEINSLQAAQSLSSRRRIADERSGRMRGVRAISPHANLTGYNRPPAFGLDADQLGVLDLADSFAREKLYALSARMDAEEYWPGEVMPEIGAAGLLGVTIAPEYGGAGLDLLAAGLVLQGFARWNHAVALSWVAHDNLCANNIYRNGNEEQRRKYLPGLCSGRKIGALGLTEPGAGSDALGSMRTTARREGDHYVLNGGKIYITNGPVADVLLVYAKTDKAKGAHGISAFIVEKDFPGFKVAQKLEKMGYRGSQTGELGFRDCRVPAPNPARENKLRARVVISGLER